MYSASDAAALRDRGHDAIAINESDELRGLDDATVLTVATLDGRAVVTENVADFARLHAAGATATDGHAGIVFVHHRRFPRTRPGRRRLTEALCRLLEAPPAGLEGSFGWWLAPHPK
jgi:hypothetical protein